MDIRKLPEYDMRISETVDLIDGLCCDVEDGKLVIDRKRADGIIKAAINEMYSRIEEEENESR